MSGTKYIYTIDLGTGGPKVALISTHGKVLAHEFEATSLDLLPLGGAEQDPGEWWQAITNASKRLMQQNEIPLEDIIAVSCTAQWSGTVAVDKTGDHLMNAVIWMDSRGQPYLDKITGGPLKFEGYGIHKVPTWIRKTGGLPTNSGKDPIAHILYIRAEHPEIYEQTYKFLEPKDWINLKLTGIFAATFDSITLHWVTNNRDIANVSYSEKLLKMSSLERSKLPDLVAPASILGPLKSEIARELGLNPGIPVTTGTPDLQSAAVGSGAVKDFEGHLYIGTSAWLTCHVPYKKTDLFHNMASLPSAIPRRYFIANEQEAGGACLTWLKDNVLFHPDELMVESKQANVYKAFDRNVEKSAAGSQGVIFTPWLNGERTPVEDHLIRSGFHNISLHTTREHLIRAVFEGVAFNSRWLLQYVEKFIKRPFPQLNMIGGGANSHIWCQIHADILQRPIRQVKDPILANSRGMAFVAAAALGLANFDQISDNIEISNTYEPNPETQKLYDELFTEYLNIYKSTRKIYQRLNRSPSS
ncbi:MAG: FGGY-family carbohydrate kinase [Candidatus Marinimicrobia bacterium]|nr:FGGY-family carbohydrate kinase [Candidatus Neomarinimicrobiota bacterium]